MQIHCTQAQWNKIQRVVRSILPQISQQNKFHHKWSKHINRLAGMGMSVALIHKNLTNYIKAHNKTNNTKQRLPRYTQVYLSVKALGYTKQLTKTQK